MMGDRYLEPEVVVNGTPPEWASSLSTRARRVLLWNMYFSDDHADRSSADFSWVTKDHVRRPGRAWWLRCPNAGERTVEEIGGAIGGWQDNNHGDMPGWASDLDVRSLNTLRNVFATEARRRGSAFKYDYKWLTPEHVRAYGRRALGEQPNCGAKALRNIGNAIGGWPEEAPPPSAAVRAGSRVLRERYKVAPDTAADMAAAVFKAMSKA